MPFSLGYGRSALFKWLAERHAKQPFRRVLDCGCGAGAMGRAARKALPGLQELVGVDVWAPTLSKLREAGTYDRLHEGDFMGLPGGMVSFDLVMFGDCLEHVSRASALKLLDMPGPRTIAARIPVGHWPQGEWGGNRAERHLWSFRPGDLEGLRVRKVTQWLAACASRDALKHHIPVETNAREDAAFPDVAGLGRYIGNLLTE